jgi:hypothetical protein
MTRPLTFLAGLTIGATIAAYSLNQSLQRSIRDGTLTRALATQAERLKADAAAARAPDEVDIEGMLR